MPSHFIARRSRIEYAKAVRRQLIDLTLGQALRNTDATDKRLSFPVFAFFGGRSPQEVQKTTSVAFDITSIITLHYLGLLETAIAYFDRIAIAPSTLSSLFVERQFIRIQQPSELAKAERIAGRRPCGGAQCCVG
jgi:hypothetical protein